MSRLAPRVADAADTAGLAHGGLVLLSCSHLFHANCMRAFEDFNIYEVSLCPCCRAQYQSIPVRL
jgi:hypothetical protein